MYLLRPAIEPAYAAGMNRFCVVALLVACSSSETRVHLDLATDPAWGIDNYQLRLDGHGATAAPLAELEMVVPSDMAGRNVELDVWGLVAGTQVAYGVTTVIPVMSSTVTAHVTLAGVSCGTWCTLGTIACANDGQTACEMQPNGCVAWSTPIACPTETPYCSNGACAAQCTDECTTGATTCDSSAAVRTCGQLDSDSCLDWSTPVPCTNGQTCSNGACTTAASCAVDGDSCDDGNSCTTADTCGGGICAGTPKCTPPANADPTCASDGTCDFACRTGYQRSGSSCVLETKLIFVSSATHDGYLEGLAGADSLCRNLAVAAGRSGTFKAWLSDSNTSAATRLTHATMPYVLVDGTVVAANWDGLTSGSLQHAIDRDETGMHSNSLVWTGSTPDGSLLHASVTCMDWSSADFSYYGGYGGPTQTGSWTQVYDYGLSCKNFLSVYCLEQ